MKTEYTETYNDNGDTQTYFYRCKETKIRVLLSAFQRDMLLDQNDLEKYIQKLFTTAKNSIIGHNEI